jgi:hypothetical protein
VHEDVTAIFNDDFPGEVQQGLADPGGDGPGHRGHGTDPRGGPGLDHVPHQGRGIGISRPGRQRSEKFRVLLNIGFQLLPLLNYLAADFQRKVTVGQDHEVRFLDCHPEARQTGALHAGAVGAGLGCKAWLEHVIIFSQKKEEENIPCFEKISQNNLLNYKNIFLTK